MDDDLTHEAEKSSGIGYLLSVGGPFVGACGLQRFYMGQIVLGFAYLFTYGFFGIGQLYDIFTMGKQIENHNLKVRVKRLERGSRGDIGHAMSPIKALPQASASPPSIEEQMLTISQLSPEHRQRLLLQFAKSHHGRITPIEVASESDLTIDKARTELDHFCKIGAADLQVSESGAMVYVFVGFISKEEKQAATSVI